MPEPVEVAVEMALIARAQAFATVQGIAISLPNIAFTPPTASVSAKWLQATFLPVPSVDMGISWNAHVQHYGLMQLSVFYGQQAGEYAPGRVASAIIDYFARGTDLVKDGTRVRINKTPYRGQMLVDGAWIMIPVSIPYQCFARQAA